MRNVCADVRVCAYARIEPRTCTRVHVCVYIYVHMMCKMYIMKEVSMTEEDDSFILYFSQRK